jgi:predicted  nucleic acid-binding Zn-ribbon protein
MTEAEKILQQQKLQTELEKLNLEKAKLAEEIKILKKKWYKNPQNLAPLATIVVALLGLSLTFMTGFFDARRLDLQNQKSLLQIDISNFSKQKDSLKFSVAASQKTLDSLNIDNTQLKTKLELIKRQLTDISIKYKADKKSIIRELDDIDRLIKANNNSEAFIKLSDLVNKLNGITGRSFSNEFDSTFK